MTSVDEVVPLIKADLPPYDEIAPHFQDVLESGRVTNFGDWVKAFESEASDFLGVGAVTVSSGTMGLVMALIALGVREGQHVAIPSFTFVATGQAVLLAGGRPLFVEIEDDFTMSAKDLAIALDQHRDVAVVLPVHTYGMPCRIGELKQVVESHDPSPQLLYDAAHAFGSALDGQKVGTFGAAEVFSLSVTKALVSVEGGMVTSGNEALLERIRKMRNYGIHENYDAHFPGMNGKMSELHAIVGVHNLRRLNNVLDRRADIAARYTDRVHSATSCRVIPVPPNVRHTYKDFTVLLPHPDGVRRDEMLRLMGENGVETRKYFWPPLHQQMFFRPFNDRPLPQTEHLAARVITLPFFTTMTESQIDRVVEVLAMVEEKTS